MEFNQSMYVHVRATHCSSSTLECRINKHHTLKLTQKNTVLLNLFFIFHVIPRRISGIEVTKMQKFHIECSHGLNVVRNMNRMIKEKESYRKIIKNQ